MRGAAQFSSSATPAFGSQAAWQSSSQRGAGNGVPGGRTMGTLGTVPQTTPLRTPPSTAWPSPAGTSAALPPQQLQQQAAGTQYGWPDPAGAEIAGPNSFQKSKSSNDGYFEGIDLKEAETDFSVAVMNFIRYAQDHAAKLLLLLGVILLVITTVRALSAGIQAMGSEQFHLLSFFSFRLSWLSFYGVAVLVVIVAVCALLTAALAGLAGWTELRPLLRLSFLIALALGFVVLLLALVTWQYNSRSRNDVVRATNLICNMPNRAKEIYGCPNANATLDNLAPPMLGPNSIDYAKLGPCNNQNGQDQRRLAEDDAGGDEELSLGGAAEPPSRRLWALESAAAYLSSFNGKKDLSGTSEVCDQFDKICKVLPAGLNVQTSCMCSGHYEALVKFTSPSFLDSLGAAAAAATDVTINITGNTSQGVRRLYKATGAFRATQGAYCAPWSGEDSETKKGWPTWCFVHPRSYCPGHTRYTCATSEGNLMYRSHGPCTDAIESRSEYVVEGLETLSSLASATKMLGILLLGVAACSVVLDMNPSQETEFMPLTQVSKAPSSEGQAVPPGFQAAKTEDEHENIFEEAQQEAVRKLRESTPIEQRRRLYALYHQAKDGNVRGERPNVLQSEERHRYDEWAKLRGMSREEAIEKYVAAVKLLN